MADTASRASRPAGGAFGAPGHRARHVVRGSYASKLTLAGYRQATIERSGLDKRVTAAPSSRSTPRPSPYNTPRWTAATPRMGALPHSKSLPIPSRRFPVILPDSETGLVQHAEIDLCLAMSLLGGPPVPARGFGLVLSHSSPMTVHEPKCELSLGESLRGGPPKPFHRLAVVLRKNRPGRIQFAEETLRSGIARLGGLTERLPLASLLRRAGAPVSSRRGGPGDGRCDHGCADQRAREQCSSDHAGLIASRLPHGRGSHARRRPALRC